MTITASEAKADTASGSIRYPDTMSSVMPVSSVISAGIGFDGSLNDEKSPVAFAQRKQLRAEIGKGLLCLSLVSHGLIVGADVPRADRQLSWFRQRHAFEEMHALESFVSKRERVCDRSVDERESKLP